MRRERRILGLFIVAFLMVWDLSLWAQVVGVTYTGGLSFKFVTSGDSSLQEQEVFFTCLKRPLKGIWVTLAPGLTDLEVHPISLVGTPISEILLRVDARLKRDVGSELSTLGYDLNQNGVLFRVWVSPREVLLEKDESSVLIKKLTLEVKLEDDSGRGVFPEVSRKITDLVNSHPRYEDLRMLIRLAILSDELKRLSSVPEELWGIYSSFVALRPSQRYSVLMNYRRSFFENGLAIGGIYRLDGGKRRYLPPQTKDFLIEEDPSFLADDLMGVHRDEFNKWVADTRPFWEGYKWEVEHFLGESFTEEEKEIVAFLLALGREEIGWPESKNLRWIGRSLLNLSAIAEGDFFEVSQWEVSLLKGLGLWRVVKAINLYILKRKGTPQAEERVERVFESLEGKGVEYMRGEEVFVPMSSLPASVSGLLREVWRDRMLIPEKGKFMFLKEALDPDSWRVFVTLLSLQFVTPSYLESVFSKKEIERFLISLDTFREESLKKASSNEERDRVEEVFVDGLKLASRVSPDLVRQHLRYKFEKKLSDEEWNRYLSYYEAVLGKDSLSLLLKEMEELSRDLKARGKRKIVILNATFFGGGVAEMIPGMYKFFERFGIEVEWQIIHPRNPSRFYAVTKKIHNIIQGKKAEFTDEDIEILEEVGRDNFHIYRSWLDDPEIGAIFFEDPQVVSTLKYFMHYAKRTGKALPAIFRLHIDVSGIQNAEEGSGAKRVWDYLSQVFTRLHGEFKGILLAQPYLNPWEGLDRAFEQPPGIDVLSEKNRPVEERALKEILSSLKEKELFRRDLSALLEKQEGPLRPVVVTGARADAWKGLLQVVLAHVNLVEEYKREKKIPPRMVLFAGGADDDPEIREIKPLLEEIVRQYEDYVYFVWNPQGKEVGALYRLAAVTKGPVVIASVREGYNLVIAEAIAQGALPITTNPGGLKRFEKILGFPWLVRLEEPVFSDAQPEDLITPDSPISRVLVKKLKQTLTSFLKAYETQPSKYQEDLEILKRHVFETSLLPMCRDYLVWVRRVLDSIPPSRSDVNLPDEVFLFIDSPEKLRSIIPRFARGVKVETQEDLAMAYLWFTLHFSVDPLGEERAIKIAPRSGRISPLSAVVFPLLFPEISEMFSPQEDVEQDLVALLVDLYRERKVEDFASQELQDLVDRFGISWSDIPEKHRVFVLAFLLEQKGHKGVFFGLLNALIEDLSFEDLRSLREEISSLGKKTKKKGGISL